MAYCFFVLKYKRQHIWFIILDNTENTKMMFFVFLKTVLNFKNRNQIGSIFSEIFTLTVIRNGYEISITSYNISVI